MLENYHDKESVGQKLQDMSGNQAALNSLTPENNSSAEQYSDMNIVKLLKIGGIAIALALIAVLGVFIWINSGP